MKPRHWPLYGLRITTPRLELRLPDLDALDALAAVAGAGVHDPAQMPFTVPWTDTSPEERARGTFQHVLGTVAAWQPEQWTLSLAVLHQGQVVGRQDLMTSCFPVTREAETGSWLGTAYQGRGIGTERRAAVAHLAFEGLGARSLTSSAMTDNQRSLGVSRKLGYRPDGLLTASVRGEAVTLQRLRLDRESWQAHRTTPVRLDGLAPCRALFGI
ncbi:GNAT family N-acetyltransferase [Streptomyces meridianus]|uniref:GNAT family N-acetyltransferase n=1 Tax=Streptomyces meridianus TaxID=2938945 RepID=A0ABT0X4J7_9ACTN|nr:GNAT family protein [Streptomyces meridianus]MCM2576587.1 GNAT family N-acetyltransferase [Streptomyces meridianus]